MESPPPVIKMLVLDNGKCPVTEWLSGLPDRVTRARITRQIDKLARGNVGVRRGVGGSVVELKIDVGPGYRVYYVYLDGTTIVLLGGGDKSDQAADIARAQKLWKKMEKAGLPEAAVARWQVQVETPPTEELNPDVDNPVPEEHEDDTKEL